MEMKEKNIDNLFKEALLEHEVSPPEEVWTNISEQIKKKKSKKLIVLWYRIAAGVTILLASTWFITKNIDTNENTTTTIVENNQLIKDKNSNNEIQNESIESQTLNDTKQNNNNSFQNRKKSSSPSTPDNSDIERDNTLLAAEKNNRSNKTGIFRIKNKEEQFGFSDETTFEHDDNTSIDKLAMLDVSLELEIPKKQIIYQEPEFNVIKINTVKENQWEIGGYYAPLYSYRALEIGNNDLDANSMMSNSEQGQYTYSGGFSVNYKVSRRFSIGTGLSVVNHSYKVSNVASLTTYSNLAYFADSRSDQAYSQSYSVNNSIGKITTSSGLKAYSSPKLDNAMWFAEESQAINNSYALPDNQVINQSFDYMEIPIFFRLKLIDRNIGINLVSGVSSYFLVNNKVTIKSSNQPDITGKTLNIKSTNLSGSLGMGLNYSLSQNLKLNMEPLFKIFLNSINTSNSINVYPYTFGIYSGISYSF